MRVITIEELNKISEGNYDFEHLLKILPLTAVCLTAIDEYKLIEKSSIATYKEWCNNYRALYLKFSFFIYDIIYWSDFENETVLKISEDTYISKEPFQAIFDFYDLFTPICSYLEYNDSNYVKGYYHNEENYIKYKDFLTPKE